MIDFINSEVLPWQSDQWQKIQQARIEQRLPHALLLYGHEGVGKYHFARQLAQSLLCLQPNRDAPCGQCSSCHLFKSQTHPDFHLLQPEGDGKVIKVDKVREMVELNSLTPHISNIKLHTIRYANRMNHASANSLLKTLEEPSDNTLILLLTSRPADLSATIRSRCQQVKFPVPDCETASNWLSKKEIKHDPTLLLSLCNQAPFLALKLDKNEMFAQRDDLMDDFMRIIRGNIDPVKTAEQWQKSDVVQIVNWMITWVIDMIRLKYGSGQTTINNIDKADFLSKLATGFETRHLMKIYDKLLEAGRLLERQVNRQLLLEGLLIPWSESGNQKYG